MHTSGPRSYRIYGSMHKGEAGQKSKKGMPTHIPAATVLMGARGHIIQSYSVQSVDPTELTARIYANTPPACLEKMKNGGPYLRSSQQDFTRTGSKLDCQA